MNSKKNLLGKSRLYAIIDRQVLGAASVTDAAARFIEAGVDIIQYRDKVSCDSEIAEYACKISKLAGATNTLFILNDFVDIASVAGCDGVHLGQHDMPIEEARKRLGNDRIIGISCHGIQEARAAQANGADYIAIGPLFETALKKDAPSIGTGILKDINKVISIPVFAVGGIDKNTIDSVTAFGVKRVAVCRALLHSQDVQQEVSLLKNSLSS